MFFCSFSGQKNCILPCESDEAAAFFAIPQWVTRLTACETHDEVIDIFRLFHTYCWSERDRTAIDRVYPQLMSTRKDQHRATCMERRIRVAEQHCSKHEGTFPEDYGEDNSTSEEAEPAPEQPPSHRYRPPAPGGEFVLTFKVLALVTGTEAKFPHRRECWHTILPGTLDQACACFSSKQ